MFKKLQNVYNLEERENNAGKIPVHNMKKGKKER